MGSILHLGFHIGAQTSTMSFYLTFTTMRTTWSTRKSAGERWEQVNEAANALHYKTLGCSSPRPKKSCLWWPRKLSSPLSKLSNWRDTLRLKICGMLRRLLSSDGKEERHYKVKSARTSFDKNNSTRRQENVMLSIFTAYELRSEVKIVTLSFAEIMSHNMRTGHKSF